MLVSIHCISAWYIDAGEYMERITLVEVDVHLTHTHDFGGVSKVATINFLTEETVPVDIYSKVYARVMGMFGCKAYILLKRVQRDRKWSDVKDKGLKI
jgi:hypothetical protein